jgi:hypothetical protein
MKVVINIVASLYRDELVHFKFKGQFNFQEAHS